jgi:glutamate synthase-like protein
VTDAALLGCPEEYTAGYPVIKHRTFGRAVPPSAPMAAHEVELPCAKLIGAARSRPRAFRPKSVVNISAMSFGSLSGSAIEALNRGAVLADCLQNTGEGGISRYHRHGGELPLHEVYGYQPGMGLPSAADREKIVRLMTVREPQGGSAPTSPSAVG